MPVPSDHLFAHEFPSHLYCPCSSLEQLSISSSTIQSANLYCIEITFTVPLLVSTFQFPLTLVQFALDSSYLVYVIPIWIYLPLTHQILQHLIPIIEEFPYQPLWLIDEKCAMFHLPNCKSITLSCLDYHRHIFYT